MRDFIKKCAIVLSVSGIVVPLQSQMRLIRTSGTGRALMRSAHGASSLKDLHRQKL